MSIILNDISSSKVLEKWVIHPDNKNHPEDTWSINVMEEMNLICTFQNQIYDI